MNKRTKGLLLVFGFFLLFGFLIDLMDRLHIACGNNLVVLTPTGNELGL